jgi:hypothetical protein
MRNALRGRLNNQSPYSADDVGSERQKPKYRCVSHASYKPWSPTVCESNSECDEKVFERTRTKRCGTALFGHSPSPLACLFCRTMRVRGALYTRPIAKCAEDRRSDYKYCAITNKCSLAMPGWNARLLPPKIHATNRFIPGSGHGGVVEVEALWLSTNRVAGAKMRWRCVGCESRTVVMIRLVIHVGEC